MTSHSLKARQPVGPLAGLLALAMSLVLGAGTSSAADVATYQALGAGRVEGGAWPAHTEVHTYFVAGEVNAPAVWVHNRCAGTWEYSGAANPRRTAQYQVDRLGRTKRAEALLTGRNPGRAKADIGGIDRPGMNPGDHRGHLLPENFLDDPSVVNVAENVFAESATSNLSLKKIMVENKIGELFDSGYHRLRMISEPRYAGGSLRPFEVRHRVYSTRGTLLLDAIVPN